MNKERLDQLLVQKGFFESRNKAQAAIMAGLIFVDGQRVDKAGTKVAVDAKIEIKGNPCPYVSRGGYKLEGALDAFKIDPKDKICLDIGVSTGGFSDCLLQRGAKQVFGVDVGYGITDLKVRNNPKVTLIERTNARNLTLETLGLKDPIIEICTIDVSFISLDKILPAAKTVLTPGAIVIALIKPQFEAGRDEVGKGGIIKDPEIHTRVIEKIKTEAEKLGFKVMGIMDSPITGAEGNKEFLLCASFN
ncbi:MAG: TlyA family RNA methyltransferase [Candidatus Saganbacteria bacterium]|nr:TlyA family RNA methyltransferase [Candidatus Saganbacteria bacterium]